MRLASIDSFNNKHLMCYGQFFKYLNIFGASRVLAPELPDISVSGTDHVLVRFRVCKGLLGAAVRHWSCFGTAGEGMSRGYPKSRQSGNGINYYKMLVISKRIVMTLRSAAKNGWKDRRTNRWICSQKQISRRVRFGLFSIKAFILAPDQI